MIPFKQDEFVNEIYKVINCIKHVCEHQYEDSAIESIKFLEKLVQETKFPSAVDIEDMKGHTHEVKFLLDKNMDPFYRWMTARSDGAVLSVNIPTLLKEYKEKHKQ